MKLLLILLAGAGIAMAADNSVTGTWDVQTEVMGNEGSAVCTLKQDGGKITGKCVFNGAEQDVTGDATEQKFTFQHGGEYNGEALTITYSGSFESATILSGELNVKPYDVSGTFKAKKKT